MARYGTLKGKSAENVIYGERTALDCMVQSAIDDGIRSKAHLVNFFNPALIHFASYTGDHKTFQKVTVVVFAESFVPMDRALKPAIVDKGDLERFMATAIEFEEPPEEAKSWQTTTSVKVEGTVVTKTCARVYTFDDKSKSTVILSQSRDLASHQPGFATAPEDDSIVEFIAWASETEQSN
jgi:uncharacterized protein YdeI (BOF family)